MTDKSGIKYAAAALLLIFAAGMLTSCNIFGLGGETIILTDPESEEIPAPETDPETEPSALPPETTAELTTELPETTAEVTTEEETTEEATTEEITTVPEPEVTETPWNLVLINPWHPLPEDYTFELATVTGKYQVDSRCADALKAMLADCKAAGHTPYICSAYRTWDDQVYLFDKKVKSFTDKGYSEEEAKILAAKETAVPGTSEHQLGLAADILCTSRPWLDEGQAKTETQKCICT